MSLFRRRYYAPLSQTCTAGACARSCKSRRAPRPRKPDGKLNRHGLGARRVALLAPRGELNQCRHPLGYVGATTKILSKVQKLVPHFGRSELYSEWGRSPGIWGPRKVPQRSEDTLWGFSEEGVSYSPVWASAPEHDEDFDRVSLITHKRLSFGRKRGVGLSFLDLERNQDKVLFSERIRKIIFLLSAKGSENDKGGIFRVAPFVNPKTPHTPTKGERARGEQPPPLSKGARVTVCKRINK